MRIYIANLGKYNEGELVGHGSRRLWTLRKSRNVSV